MKKLCFLLFVLLCLLTIPGLAQYTVLYNFEMTRAGASPVGPLTLSGNKLYGSLQNCEGKNFSSCIYSIDTNGKNYRKLKEFKRSFSCPGLVISGNALYGMTGYGSPIHDESVYTIGTDGSRYKVLHKFNANEDPVGSLTLSDNILYGTVSIGTDGNSYIFSIHTDGSGYTDIFDFNKATGVYPESSLTLYRNVLYGVMRGDDTHDKGCVFSVHTDGSGYKKLYDFTGTSLSMPWGALILSGKVLYGRTLMGGIPGKDAANKNNGCIFSIDTDGTGFKILHKFGEGGCLSYGLTISEGRLYGVTSFGGTGKDPYGDGIIFSIDTNGIDYRVLFNFNGLNGSFPDPLIIIGNTFFGVTVKGGTEGDTGVIFKFRDETIIK